MNYVLYHDNCPDGFGAAFAAFLLLDKEAKYIPVNYYQDPPAEVYRKDNNVWILDFSYKRSVLEDLNSKVKSLLVLDHHKTAEADLKDLPYCQFDMTRSGALMTFDHFFGDDLPGRRMFEYISDRDLWTFALPNSKEINAYLMSLPYDFSVYLHIFKGFNVSHEFNGHVNEGKAILRQTAKEVDMICSQAEVVEMIVADTHFECAVVNATSHWSDVGHKLCIKYGVDCSISYYFDKNGKCKHSIRSEGDFDVSKIAKAFGGGGHKNAAGFTIDKPITKENIVIRKSIVTV
jgi:nanoRNase/pAp phosphatase (c-di-AMP/oligoRNAs hydrolase)